MRRACLLLFLVGRLFAEGVFGPAIPEEGLPGGAVGIPADCWPQYFGSEVEGDLIDPQGLLMPREVKEAHEFLSYHADDSRIPLRVMVFEKGQALPDNMLELVTPVMGEAESAVLILYVLGEPERSELWVSDKLRAEVGDTEIARMTGQAAREAQEKVALADQLQEFCVQLSIRLYWVERSLGWVDTLAPEETESPASRPVEAVEGPSRTDLIKESLRGAWDFGGTPFSIGLGVLILGSLARWVMVRRRRCVFPQFDVAPRLGGAHGAGVGAVMSFGSTTQSPSAQREKTRDYLGGI